jgi:hypothetical protein
MKFHSSSRGWPARSAYSDVPVRRNSAFGCQRARNIRHRWVCQYQPNEAKAHLSCTLLQSPQPGAIFGLRRQSANPVVSAMRSFLRPVFKKSSQKRYRPVAEAIVLVPFSFLRIVSVCHFSYFSHPWYSCWHSDFQDWWKVSLVQWFHGYLTSSDVGTQHFHNNTWARGLTAELILWDLDDNPNNGRHPEARANSVQCAIVC